MNPEQPRQSSTNHPLDLHELEIACREGVILTELHQQLVDYDPQGILDVRSALQFSELTAEAAGSLLGDALSEAVRNEQLRIKLGKRMHHKFPEFIQDASRLVLEFDIRPTFSSKLPHIGMLAILDEYLEKSRHVEKADRTFILQALTLFSINQDIVGDLKDHQVTMVEQIACRAFCQAIVNGDFDCAQRLSKLFNVEDKLNRRLIGEAIPELLWDEYRGANPPRSYRYSDIERRAAQGNFTGKGKFTLEDYADLGVKIRPNQLLRHLRAMFAEETKEKEGGPSDKFFDFARRFKLSRELIADEFFKWLAHQPKDSLGHHPGTVASWVKALELEGTDYHDRLPSIERAINFVSFNLSAMDPALLDGAADKMARAELKDAVSPISFLVGTEAAYIARIYRLNRPEVQQAAVNSVKRCWETLLCGDFQNTNYFYRVQSLQRLFGLPAVVDCEPFMTALSQAQLPTADLRTADPEGHLSPSVAPAPLKEGPRQTLQLLGNLEFLASKNYLLDLESYKAALVTRTGALLAYEVLYGDSAVPDRALANLAERAAKCFDLSASEAFQAARYATALVREVSTELVSPLPHRSLATEVRLNQQRRGLECIATLYKVPNEDRYLKIEDLIDQIGFVPPVIL